VIPLHIDPPNGSVSLNARPWAQVWIDGAPVGETPLVNMAVPLGEHEVVFRHPQLGERRQKAIVRAGAATQVSVSFER
jgi:serine/threonine-protein kinase